MNDLTSHSGSLANQLRSFLVPSQVETLLYLFASSAVLVGFNAKALLQAFQLNLSLPDGTVENLYNERMAQVKDLAGSLLEGEIVTVLFWAFVGSGIYIAVWLLQNTVLNLRNDIVADLYRHPKNYSHVGYWSSVIAQKMFFVCSLVALAVFTLAAVKFIFPVITKLFYVALFDFRLPESVLELFVAVLCGAAAIFVFVLLVRFVTHSWQWITSNF